ncbi:condensation domain-containing protein [Oerskovia rustica]|uniref:AMP-binding protein n=1 Tax=Oerskovia rustica TaxID=2762237 RepID=A0ABR8RSY4_9CELL|nr:condensation domain-containing protein [Oerskovia rustica]MBD7950906.1 AMP-binding protein [Oerskovia rustica]
MSSTEAIEAVWPLTALQRALTAHAGLTDGHDPYVGQTLVELRGPLDGPALERSLDALLVAHPNLRAGFAVDDDLDPVQFVPIQATAEVVWYDADVPGSVGADTGGRGGAGGASGAGEVGADDALGADRALRDAARAAAEAERSLPFDPADPPLVRFGVVSLGAEHHVLVVTSHHLVLDGWSMPLLVREVARLYGAELSAEGDEPTRRGRPGLAPTVTDPSPTVTDSPAEGDALAPARGRFVDHLVWLGRQDADAARAHWREALADVEPSRWPVADAWTATGGTPSDAFTTHRTLGTTAVEAIRSGARAQGVTSATLVRAAWGLTVAAHSGSSCATFAVPVALRSPEVEHADEIVGMLTESVVARVDADAATTLGEVVADHSRRWNASWEHQHVGLRGIQAATGSETPVATTLVSFEQAPGAGVVAPTIVGLDPVRLRVLATQDDTHFPLALAVDAGPDTWDLALDAHAAAFTSTAADALLATFERILLASATTPGARVAGLDLVPRRPAAPTSGGAATASTPGAPAASAAAPAAGLAADTAAAPAAGRAPTSRPALVTEVLADSIARHPHAGALVVGDRRWTFAELDLAVTRAERRLTACGARPGDALAIDLPRDERIVHVILAALRRGLAVTPLPHGAPERRAHVLRISGARLLWDEDGPRPLDASPVPGGRATDAPGASAAVGHDDAPAASRTPEPSTAVGHDLPPAPDAATLRACVGSIIFTSGSTGEPKGVAVGQDALAHLLDRHRTELYPAGERLRVAHTAAFSFDAHYDAFLALAAGHELHVLDEDVFLDPVALRDYAAEHAIDYLDFTPTVWGALLAGADWTRLPRICVAGGEAFGPALWTRMRELAARTGARVVNLYGPTEATVDALAADVADTAEPVVGRPVGRTQAVVLDAALREVPAGTVGELYLAGPQLAEAYLGRAGLTASRFVARPGGVPGERMYRTGDLARRAEDGTLSLLGRNDDQISLHGFRIEPGEVEQALVALDGVAEAAVVLAEHPRWGARLVAYVTGAGLDPDVLRAAAGERLARHLVPTAFVTLDALPLTRHGKLDRRALPAPDWDGSRTSGGGAGGVGTASVGRPAAEPTPVEAQVRAAAARVLGGENVGLDESFFAAGGDSIDALQLIAALRREGLVLSPADLFAARTPREMARRVRPDGAASGSVTSGAGAGGASEVLVALTAAQAVAFDEHVRAVVAGASRVVDVLPLTPTQLGMVAEAARDAADAYRTTTRFTVTGLGDDGTARVVGAVQALVGRHANLRGGVLQLDLPAPVFFVPDAARVLVAEHDGRGLDPVALAALLDEVDLTERSRLGDLSLAPLVSGAVVRTGEDEHVLVLAMHHLLTDGWSVPLLAQDLRRTLTSDAGWGAGPGGPTFRDYLTWLRDAESTRAEVEALWRAELAGLEEPSLLGVHHAGAPTVTDSPADGDARVVTTLPTGAEGLRVAARRAEVTPATVVQTAWGLVVAALTGQPEAVVGSTVAGRPTDLDGADRIIGMFVSSSPVRVPAGAHLAADALLQDVQARQARLLDAHHVGLPSIARIAGHSLFDTLVVVESYPRGTAAVAVGGAAVTLDPSAGHPRQAGTSPSGGRHVTLGGQARHPRPVDVVPTGGHDATHYPVTVTVLPSADGGLTIEIEERPGTLDPAVSAVLPAALTAAVEHLARGGALPTAHALVGEVRVPRPAPAEPAPRTESRPAPRADAQGDANVPTSGAVGPHDHHADERTEHVRAEIARVLGDDVGPTTDFFAAGGDSISAMQLVGALRGRGLSVTVGAVFAGRTAAGIALAATEVAPAPARPAARTADVAESGDLPLTPALAWLLETGGDHRGFVQVRVLRTPAGLTEDSLRAALAALVEAHGALRLAVHDGAARVLDAASPAVVAGSGDVLHVTDGPLAEALRGAAAQVDPATGRVLRAVWDRGTHELALVAHHVAVDAVSWRILVDDLRTLVAGGSLPPASSSLRAAASAMHDEAAHRAGELPAWVDVHSGEAVSLTARPLDPALDTVSSAREVVVRLGADDTRLLLGLAPEHRTDHVLLAALSLAAADVAAAGVASDAASDVAPGAARAGADLVVETEGHGRRLDGEGPDLSRTVGWFTTTWPLRLAAVPGATPTAHLRATSRQAAAVPGDGRAYGLLRHLAPGASAALRDAAAACPPQVLVNYLGRETESGDDWGSVADAAHVESALGLHADLPLSHPVELNAYVADGPVPELVARWILAPAVTGNGEASPSRGEPVTLGEGVGSFGETLVEAWVQHLRALVRGAVAEAGDPTVGPATTIPAGAPWPLTPVQRGMVLHALEAPVDRYTSAIDVGLDGPLDVAALRAAAADVLAAHPQLRLAVAARGPQDVGLVVTDVTEVPLHEVTLPDDVAHPDAVRRALGEIMADELDRPFDLARPPLLRLVVVRVGSHEGARHRLVVTNHHVLLDGWSVPFLVDLLLGAYVRRVGAPAGATPSGSPTGLVLPTPSTAWQLSRRLARRDTGAVDVWRDALAGARPVRVAEPEDTGERPAVLHATPEGLGTRLVAAARAAQVTTADVVTSAWGLVLAALTGESDVLTGTTVAGRPAEIEGAHDVLGMFVNTVPVRIAVRGPGDSTAWTLADLVRSVHERQAGLRDVDHVGLADVQRALGVGELFDTLLVVENYPRDADAQPGAGAGLRITDVQGDDRTQYPLALTVDASEGLSVQLDHLASVPADRAGAALAAVVDVLGLLADAPSTPVEDVLAGLAERHPALCERASAGQRGGVASTADAPEGAPVGVVREVFAEALGVQRVADDDNFFALGGDSIVAMKVTTTLRARGWTVDPRLVFAAPTPATLAVRARLTAVPATTAAVSGPAAPRDPAGPDSPPLVSPLLAMSASELGDLDDLMRNLT